MLEAEGNSNQLHGPFVAGVLLALIAFCCFCVNIELIAKVCLAGAYEDARKLVYIIAPVVQIALSCIILQSVAESYSVDIYVTDRVKEVFLA